VAGSGWVLVPPDPAAPAAPIPLGDDLAAALVTQAARATVARSGGDPALSGTSQGAVPGLPFTQTWPPPRRYRE
jgi:hypothetical protein